MTGAEIKEIRRSLFMTQQEFAKKIGVHLVTVSDWENGKRNPSLKHLKIITELKNGVSL